MAEPLAAVGEQNDDKKCQEWRQGINQIKISMVIECLVASRFLPLHQVDLVRRDGIAPAVDGDEERQANGDFCRGDGKDDHSKHLAGNHLRLT